MERRDARDRRDAAWVCLAWIDYNTFTGANIDDFVNWAPSTDYFKLQFALTTNGNVYYASGVSSGFVGNSLTCTTGSTEPTSTTAGNPGTTDGGCAWLYVGNVGYSSKAKILPHELASYFWPGGFTQAMVPQYNYHDTLRLWWGGRSSSTRTASPAKPRRSPCNCATISHPTMASSSQCRAVRGYRTSQGLI